MFQKGLRRTALTFVLAATCLTELPSQAKPAAFSPSKLRAFDRLVLDLSAFDMPEANRLHKILAELGYPSKSLEVLTRRQAKLRRVDA